MSEYPIPNDLKGEYQKWGSGRFLQYEATLICSLIERIARLEAEKAALSAPVTHDEVIAVQALSGHSLQAMTYAAICNGVLAARAAK